MERPDVENIPGDLDRFLGNFFSRRGWRSEIKYDPAEDRLYLDVRLANAKLSADDRFFSLVEYYARAQDNVLRAACRPAAPVPRVRRRRPRADRHPALARLQLPGRQRARQRHAPPAAAAQLPAAVPRAASCRARCCGRSSSSSSSRVVGLRVDVVILVALGRARGPGLVHLVHGGPAKVTSPAAPHGDALAALADVAERLQRRLLPAAPPELAGLDIAFTYRSASTGVLSGGDFVDYYTRPPSGSLAFAIGDVAGKGVDAMATTFVTKFMLRAAVHGGQLSWPTRPGEALQELRNGLLEQPDFGADTERFVTVLFGQLDPAHGPAAAGHRRSPDTVPRARRRRRAPAADDRAGHRRRARRGPRALPHGDPAARHRATSSSSSPTASPSCATPDGRFFERRMGDELAGCHGSARRRRRRRARGGGRAVLGAPARATTSPSSASASPARWSKLFAPPADKGGSSPADEGGTVSQRSRLRSQDGFIREVVWIVVILTIIAVVILDGMAIFNAYQSAGDSATNAAEQARTEYAAVASTSQPPSSPPTSTSPRRGSRWWTSRPRRPPTAR